MKFENTFVVQAPVDKVWAALLDLERVAPCMPGAEVLERTSEDAYKVGVKVKVGPITMLYRGEIEIVERDESAFRATMRARAKEARGQGTANADVHMTLVEQADGTQTTIATELALSGKAAAMGRGVIADVSERLVAEFADNLAAMLGPGSAQAAAAQASGPVNEPRGAVAAVQAQPETVQAPGVASQPPPAPPPDPSPPPTAAAPAQSALPAGRIAAGVIGHRLTNPRTLLITAVTFALGFGAIGYALGKAT